MYYYATTPAQPKRRIWPWFALAGAAVSVLCCAALLFTSPTPDHDGQGQDAANGSSAGPTASPASPARPGIGDPVRDGKFEFIVREVDCGEPSVGDGAITKNAQGQYCLVTITVKNIGDRPQTLLDSNQKAIGSNAAQYATDSQAGWYANPANRQVWITEINPGNQVTGVLVFDMPKDVNLSSLQLHDSALSGGAEVKIR